MDVLKKDKAIPEKGQMKPIISIDWLTFNIQVNPWDLAKNKTFQSNDKYIIEYEELGTRIFENRAIIYKDSIKVATLVYKPKSSIIQENLGQIQIANIMLYTTNIIELANELIQFLGVRFLSLSRVDICCDSVSFIDSEPSDFINLFVRNEIIRLSRQGGYIPFKSSKSIEYTGVSWVSKKGANNWKLYNKSQEMRDNNNHKRYIREIWKFHGWDEINDVWRIELSLTCFSKQLFIDGEKYLTTSIESVVNGAVRLFVHNLTNTFKFCYNEGNKNISRNRKYQFYDIEEITLKRVIPLSGIPDITRRTKMVITELFETIARKSEKELAQCLELYDSLIYFVRLYHLEDYFEIKFKTDFETALLDRDYIQGYHIDKVLIPEDV